MTPANNLCEEKVMNWDRIEGQWKQLKGKVREQWGKLSDDDLDVIGGKRTQLSGKIQERYGIAKDAAEQQIKDWETSKVKDTWFDKNRTVIEEEDYDRELDR
jgi:uncharacterized protein YjbJ (UPF0337 family)